MQSADAPMFFMLRPSRVERPARAHQPMPWSIQVGWLLGIGVSVHVTFILLLVFIALGDVLAGQGVQAVMRGTLFTLALFGTVLLHELGHAVMARRYGLRTADLTLLPLGGVARLEGFPSRPVEQLAVALAGPAVNLGIALALWVAVSTLNLPWRLDLDASRAPWFSCGWGC